MAAETRDREQARRTRRIRQLVGAALAAAALVVVSVAVSSGSSRHANAADGGQLVGAAASMDLFAGIPQHGTLLGRASAPIRLVEFADLQCPYCDEYAVGTLPTLVSDYVRSGRLQMQFENLSFIGPDSVKAGRVAAATEQQNRLWNFVDLLYLNQGEENTGYVTTGYLRGLLAAVPGINVTAALSASRTPAADQALNLANLAASKDGVNATPTFLIGRTGGPLHVFQPTSLTAAPFRSEINRLLGTSR
jgi:protein-disulfide isomerase